jgi:hypothetical protein
VREQIPRHAIRVDPPLSHQALEHGQHDRRHLGGRDAWSGVPAFHRCADDADERVGLLALLGPQRSHRLWVTHRVQPELRAQRYQVGVPACRSFQQPGQRVDRIAGAEKLGDRGDPALAAGRGPAAHGPQAGTSLDAGVTTAPSWASCG